MFQVWIYTCERSLQLSWVQGSSWTYARHGLLKRSNRFVELTSSHHLVNYHSGIWFTIFPKTIIIPMQPNGIQSSQNNRPNIRVNITICFAFEDPRFNLIQSEMDIAPDCVTINPQGKPNQTDLEKLHE